MWNLKNKINKTETDSQIQGTDGCQNGSEEILGDCVKKVKGLGCANWQLQNNHRDVKYSVGNTVNNTVITTCSARWALDLPGESLCKLYKCLPLCCTPKTNINIECQL